MKKRSNILVTFLLGAVLCAFFILGVSPRLATQSAYAATHEETYYLGGTPIGIVSVGNRWVVSETVGVFTKEGSFFPAQKAGVRKGDILLTVDGKTASDVDSFRALTETPNVIRMEVKRGGAILTFDISPVFDAVQQKYKIGIAVRNDLSGIGTLTYYKSDGTFGALGHLICDGFGYHELYSQGEIYDCTVLGYNLPSSDRPGELRGRIERTKIGNFTQNGISGIKGTMDFRIGTPITTAKRQDVVPGKAQIYTTVDGKTPHFYDIEILRCNKQKEIAEKSMVIRVTDRDLLDKTGGILQGMSGSPILQNGKLVGAVTHVLTNDSTLGYGIYIDWMT